MRVAPVWMSCSPGLTGRVSGSIVDLDEQFLFTPFFGLFVGFEEDVEFVAFDRATFVDDFDGAVGGVAGDGETGSEGKQSDVGGDEFTTVVTDVFPTGGDPFGVLAATDFARTVRGNDHRLIRDG